jgi:SAM-dependent methyltransferase
MKGMGSARYDGFADWYDSTFSYLDDDDGSAGLVARLLGPADPDDPVCLDIGCGTGLHFAAVQAAGYRVIGADLSADQLRIAATRTDRVLLTDAARLPLRDASVSLAITTFTHTDVDDFAATIAEATRVVRPGGRLVYVGLHPAYVGAFVDRTGEPQSHDLHFNAGYGYEELQFDGTGRFPVRSRVGARNLTLATFLGAFLAQPTLRLSSIIEMDTRMRPWRPQPSDGRIVPWNLAVLAQRTDAAIVGIRTGISEKSNQPTLRG